MKKLEDYIEALPKVDANNDSVAARMLADIKKHPLVARVDVDENTNYIDVHTRPIILTNPYGTGTLNLGCLIIKFWTNGGYEVYRDSDVPDAISGRSQYVESRTHPHVSNGHVCTGSANTIINQINATKDISMFVTFMIQFLQTYDRRNPYWSPWFKEPCAECGKAGSMECRWCVCFKCSTKVNGDRCGGCARWKAQSAGVACAYIKDFLSAQVSKMDEDDFLKAANQIEVLFK